MIREYFTIYTIICLRCGKEYNTRSNIISELWRIFHRYLCGNRKDEA